MDPQSKPPLTVHRRTFPFIHSPVVKKPFPGFAGWETISLVLLESECTLFYMTFFNCTLLMREENLHFGRNCFFPLLTTEVGLSPKESL